METVTYRPADITDAPNLSRMARQAFCDTFSHYEPQALAAFLDQRYSPGAMERAIDDAATCVVLAMSGPSIAGYAVYGEYRLPVPPPATPVHELHRLYVARDWHGKGIGAALMARFLDAAKESSAACVCLGVWEGNVKAQVFYRKYGFVHTGTYFYPPIGETVDNEWIMSRDI